MAGHKLHLAAGLLLVLAVSTASADVVGVGERYDSAGSTELDLTLLPAQTADVVTASRETALADLSDVLRTRFIRGDRFAPVATATGVQASLDTNQFIPLPELSSVILLTLTGGVSLVVWWFRRKGTS